MSILSIHFAESEKAIALPNSKGRKKSRIHIYHYDGAAGMDRYAVAAKKIYYYPGQVPKLSAIQKKFYVLLNTHENGQDTWYKINKKSLEKRLGLKTHHIAKANIHNDLLFQLENKYLNINSKYLGLGLDKAPAHLKNNRGFVIAGMRQDITSLRYASFEVMKDKKFLLELIRQFGEQIMEFADENLRTDKKFLRNASSINNSVLKFADPSILRDKNFFLSLVKSVNGESAINNSVLKFADLSILRDKDFFLSLAKSYNGNALEYADETLKKDKLFVLEMARLSNTSAYFAHESLKKDWDFELRLFLIEYKSENLLPSCLQLIERISNHLMPITKPIFKHNIKERIALLLKRLILDSKTSIFDMHNFDAILLEWWYRLNVKTMDYNLV